jgi:hypothetical protein
MSTAKRSPPFRAEHVGSLLRPDELVQKRYAVAAGKADAEELKPIEDKSVTEVVKLQKDCGFHAVSSGEYTRYVFLFLIISKHCFPASFVLPQNQFPSHHNQYTSHHSQSQPLHTSSQSMSLCTTIQHSYIPKRLHSNTREAMP